MKEMFKRKTGKQSVLNVAVGCLCVLSVNACASKSIGGDRVLWTAYGYLSPGANSEPEIIGEFDDLDACKEAADGWTSRQVVGNPVFAECLPVDRW